MKRITVAGFLDDDLAARVVGEMRAAAGQPIDIRIDSEGGRFAVAVAILLEMEEHSFPVFATVTGFAGSAAALLALSADLRRIDRRGSLMLHYASPSSAEAGREMRQLVGEYTKQHPGDVARWLALEKTFDAEAAVRCGLADRIIDAGSPEPVRLRDLPKRKPARWLAPYRELFEEHDLRPSAHAAHAD